VCTVALIGSVVPAILASLHWPLVGDSSLMHYVIFLQKQGLIPYKDIIDINLPGTYAFEAIAMRCFGQGALAWRIYDLALLVSMALAAMLLAGRRNWFGGVLAGVLFALVHLQDGLEQGGQRNLLMAVLLLWSYVALFSAQKSSSGAMSLLAGWGLGCTVTIKPTMLPLALALICMMSWTIRRNGLTSWKPLGNGMLGLFLPPLVALGWLKKTGALPAFIRIFVELLPMHAQLGRQKLSFLMSHCFSPIAAIAILWSLLYLLERPHFSFERVQLLVGIFGTYLAYIAEGKGYPYQRYPFLAILLVMIGIDVSRALSSRGITRNLGICTCGFSCFLLAPRYAWLIRTFQNQTPFQSALAADLSGIGTPTQLSGDVQCLDTFGGCINTLYDLRVRQSTGFLYDCYLFAGDTAEMLRYRDAFWTSFQANNPRIVVATNQFCFGDTRGFGKLDMWPRLATTLTQEYEIKTAWKSTVYQHWWSRKDIPTEYRIYLRKATDSQQTH
jgi:hypothetical protein